MYDTIKVRMQKDAAILAFLQRLKENGCRRGTKEVGGDIIVETYETAQSLIFVYADGVTFEINLSKLANGNNVQNATRAQIIAGVQRYEYSTGLQIRKGYVTRLDIGACIQMEHDTSLYIGRVKSYPRLYLTEYSNKTAQFSSNTGGRVVLLYDKNQECKKKGKRKPPPSCLAANTLRVEVQNKTAQSVGSIFKTKRRLTLGDVLQSDLWSKAAQALAKMIGKIVFRSGKNEEVAAAVQAAVYQAKTSKGAKKQRLCEFILDSMCELEVLRKELRAAVDAGEISERTAARSMKSAKEVHKLVPIADTFSEEFRTKVNAACTEYNAQAAML